MDNINIGFIGGCLNRQPGIEERDNYISIVKQLLYDEGMNATTYSGLYLNYNEALRRIKLFLETKPVNVLCFFLRPFPLLPLYKLSIKYPKPDNTVSSMLHPALFNRKAVWNEKLTKDQSSGAFIYIPRRKFGLRDINITLGLLCGLGAWATHYLNQIVCEIKQACDEKNIELIILTPPRSPGSVMGNYVCLKTTQEVITYCHTEKINVININALAPKYFENDLIHMNANGHKQIANMIFEKLVKQSVL